jgi:hypothetical protein
MQRSKRRKRIIEIYFILYLAALVFILPDSSFRPGNGNSKDVIGDFASGFSLIPEKTSMLCKVVVEPNGQKIVYVDSVNTIFYTGDFENVQFEFIFEDQATKQTISLIPGKTQTIKFFRVVEVPEKKAAMFFWQPRQIERLNNAYLVRVVATAKSKRVFGEKIPEQFTYKATTSFTLIIVLMNAITGEQSVAQNFLQQTPSGQFPFLNEGGTIPTGFGVGKITLATTNSNVTAIAYQQWTNTIYASNINLVTDVNSSDLKLNLYPEPKNNGGDAKIAEIKPDYVLIRGVTPSSGKLTVELYAKRKYDGQEARTSFVVVPQQIEEPRFKRYIYPGQTDTVEPNLPLIGSDVKAIIRDGDDIRASSYRGEKILFTPQISDTGKKLIFERFVDNRLYGQTYYIYVLNFPDPKIYDVIIHPQREVEIITQAFGYVENNRNEVVRLELSGNVSERFLDMRGKMQDLSGGNLPYRIQHFRLKPKNIDQPFVFGVVAVDKLGRKSAIRRITAD